MSENNFNSENNPNSGNTRVEGGNDFNFETEIVSNENGKKSIKISKLTPNQKEALMSSGIAFAGLAAGAGVFSMLSLSNEPDIQGVQTGEAGAEHVGTETLTVEVDMPIASVSNSNSESMSFNQAFAAAREELGPGGVFVFEGDIYHTYSASEWNNMSEADRLEFSGSISIQNADVTEAPASEDVFIDNGVEPNSDLNPSQETETENVESEEMEIIGYDLDNDGVADMYVFDLDENGVADVLIDSDVDGVYDVIAMNVDFESDADISEYETYDVEIYPEDLVDIPVVTVDRESPEMASENVNVNDDLIFDEFADNDFDANFDNESDVSDFIG